LRDALQILIESKEGRETVDTYAATPDGLATDFSCPTASLPSNLFTCPFLIMCIASIPISFLERRFAEADEEPFVVPEPRGGLQADVPDSKE